MGDNLQKFFFLLALMAALALLETWLPWRPRNRCSVAPNLGLTVLFFALNLGLTVLVLVAALWSQRRGFGPLHSLGGWTGTALGVVLLDFSAYAVHVLMHKVGWMWRFHRVHHSDLHVDVTTAFRQHPGETAFRFVFTFAPALLLGVSPAATATYRLLSGISALLEHANLRVAPALDRAWCALFVSPVLHKVHHSRVPAETDSNYGNIFSLFDRLFGTFTPSAHAAGVRFGLDGFDQAADQRLTSLLRMPWGRWRTAAAEPFPQP